MPLGSRYSPSLPKRVIHINRINRKLVEFKDLKEQEGFNMCSARLEKATVEANYIF